MDTRDYMSALKKKLDVQSDYQLAKKLDITTQAVSRWRSGKSTMGDDLAPFVGQMLNVPTEKVLADLHAERERNPELVQFWQSISRQFARAACMLAALAGLNITCAPETHASPAFIDKTGFAASQTSGEYKFPNSLVVCIIRMCRRVRSIFLISERATV